MFRKIVIRTDQNISFFHLSEALEYINCKQLLIEVMKFQRRRECPLYPGQEVFGFRNSQLQRKADAHHCFNGHVADLTVDKLVDIGLIQSGSFCKLTLAPTLFVEIIFHVFFERSRFARFLKFLCSRYHTQISQSGNSKNTY